jgi:hypothetical protein
MGQVDHAARRRSDGVRPSTIVSSEISGGAGNRFTPALKNGAGRRASFPDGTVPRFVDARTSRRTTSALLNYATRHSSATSTQGGWMICVVVAARMNHQRVAFYVNEFEPGRQYRIARVT